MRKHQQILTSFFCVLLLTFLLPVKSVSSAPASIVYFNPATVTVNPNQSFNLEAVIDPGTNQVTAVEVHLTFGSNILKLNSISHSSVFSQVLPVMCNGQLTANPCIDNNTGTATFIVGVAPGAAVSTVSPVATLAFNSLNPTSTTTVPVAYTNQTMAAALNESGDVITSRRSASVTVQVSSPTSIPITLTPTKTPTLSPIPVLSPTLWPTNIVISPTIIPGAGQSTITIFAAGTPADGVYPTMQLLIDNQVVATWTDIRGDARRRRFIPYTYTHPSLVTADRIKVAFVNDLRIGWWRNDRNLRVDKIMVDGATYQSEKAYSTGGWRWKTGCTSGYLKSEWLFCNGYFQY